MKSICHMHIPKTGGRYLESTVLDFLNYDCKINGIDTRYALKFSHNGWSSIDDDTFIFTSIRNPVQRTISHFLFYNTYVWGLSAEEIKQSIFEYLDKEENSFILNYQTKYLTSTDPLVGSKLDSAFDYDLSLLEDRKNRINVLLRTDMLSDVVATSIYNQACEWLEIPASQQGIISIENAGDKYINDISQEIIQSLTEEEVTRLSNMNSLDMNLYESI